MSGPPPGAGAHLGVALHQALLHDLNRGLEPAPQLRGGVCVGGLRAPAPRGQPLRYVVHNFCHARLCVRPDFCKLRATARSV